MFILFIIIIVLKPPKVLQTESGKRILIKKCSNKCSGIKSCKSMWLEVVVTSS